MTSALVVHLAVPFAIASALFGTGVYTVLARRNAILVLMGVELLLNAANVLLVTFDVYLRDHVLGGQSLALFVVTVAAAEVGVGLALVLRVFRTRATVALDDLTLLADRDVT